MSLQVTLSNPVMRLQIVEQYLSLNLLLLLRQVYSTTGFLLSQRPAMLMN